jgi:hypothetical protein
MFKLDLSPSYFAPCRIALADAEGVVHTHEFELRFNRLPQTRVNEVIDGVRSGQIDHAAFFAEVLVGWRHVQDADGNELPYSAENLACLREVVGASGAMVGAWFTSLVPGLAEKN